MGQPLDHRLAIKRAHWQPRTNVAEAIRGKHVQSRTHVGHANRENAQKEHIYICSYNPQSISDSNQQDRDIMMQELEGMKWDIVGLPASQIKESGIEVLPQGHYLFTSGNDTSRTNGVSLLVHKRIIPAVCDFKALSDRLASLTIQGEENKIVLIVAYFPTCSHSDEDVNELYNKIQATVDKIPQRDFVFLLGDFNARVGNLCSLYPNCIGRNTVGNSNDRGEQLAQFCSANNLYITNTFFEKRRIHTWNHPNGRNFAQIDFIITRSKHATNVCDSEVLNCPSISDHRMVRVKALIKT